LARPRSKLVDYLQYLGLRLFEMFLHMFDVQRNYRTARWVGEVLWWLLPKYRRIARGHLRRSFPDWSDEQIDRVARRSFRHLVCLGVEVLFTPRLITPGRWRRHIRLVNGAENARLLVRRDAGLIYVTGHFGNWEIMGYTLAMLGFPTVSVARPLDNPYVNEHILGIRERTGQSILYKKGATAGMDEVLARRGVLAFIADQDAGRKGLYVDFFGRPASTYKAIALMAIRHNVPIVIAYGKRLSDRFEFEMGVERIIHPADWAGVDDEVTWITREFTRAMEKFIRADPGQYMWVHRRWKHRPDGTRVPGDGVA